MTFLLFTPTHSAIKHTFKKTNTINFSIYLFSQTFSATKHIFKETNTLNFSHKWDLAQQKKPHDQRTQLWHSYLFPQTFSAVKHNLRKLLQSTLAIKGF